MPRFSTDTLIGTDNRAGFGIPVDEDGNRKSPTGMNGRTGQGCMSRNGSIRGQLTAALLSAALFAFPACESSEPPPSSDAVVGVRESQYRIAIESSSPDSPDSLGRLRVRVEPQNGWKVALEAPATLRLDATAGLEFNGESDATERSKGHLEFTRTFRAESAGDTVAQGQIKFGICEGDESLCVLVQRKLDVPLKVAFAQPE